MHSAPDTGVNGGADALLPVLGALLDQVLDLQPADRESWLARLRVEHPVHAAELERLLAAEAELDARGFLPDGAWDPETRGGRGLAGQRLGAWTVERPLGQGGMGTVWLARRSDGRFEGTAAVKILNLALLDPIGSERFRREGTMLARLSHPNIARLLDAGVTSGGQPYLVLEHVEGTRIDRYCDERRLTPVERIELFQQVLAAVAHAHANLLVHRDLKPSNILVATDGTVKLLDFGIAKLLEDQGAGGSAASTLTDLGGRALTPEYAAPEQLGGGPITTATDVYALGVLLYFLLAGRHPTGEGSLTTADHLKGILDTPPPRLSAAVTGAEARASALERLRRLYAGDLDNIVAKALKKAPGERYPTVGAYAEDLRRYLDHQPVSARPDSLRYRAGKFVARNAVPVALASLAGLALVGGLAGTITQAARATAQAARADSAARAAAEERDFALRQLSRVEAVNDLNNFLLSDAAPSGKPFTVGALMGRAESIVERDRADSGINRIELFIALGRQYWSHDEDAKARRLLERAYGLSRMLRDPSTRARAACALAAALARAGDFARAEALTREGLAELANEPRFVIDRIFCLMRGSEVARESEDGAASVARMEAAEQLFRELRFPAPALDLHIQMNLAEAYRGASRLPEAARAFEQAHARLVEMGRENTEAAGTLFNNWALTLHFGGQPLAAEPLFRRAIAISQADTSLEAVSPMLLNNYARTLGMLGRLSEAARYAEQAYRSALRAGHEVVIIQSLLLRAGIYSNLGDADRADRLLTELEPRFRAFPRAHPAFMGLLRQRGLNALKRGDLKAAMDAADSAVVLGRTNPAAGDYLPSLLLLRAETALAMHRYADAQRDARAALDAARALVAGDAPSSVVGSASLSLGHALRGQGAVDQA
ncbi:MAG TPA: serine/threonine-protein kinase, partial [Gemmatimonadales bacterium]|nr:serine/threonine-protein kinase [Gemmatimonadales bacterium]